MNKLIITLNLSKEQVLTYYKGQAKNVRSHALDGRVVQFPAQYLREVTTPEGVQGRFELQFDNSGKLHSIRKVV